MENMNYNLQQRKMKEAERIRDVYIRHKFNYKNNNKKNNNNLILAGKN